MLTLAWRKGLVMVSMVAIAAFTLMGDVRIMTTYTPFTALETNQQVEVELNATSLQEKYLLLQDQLQQVEQEKRELQKQSLQASTAAEKKEVVEPAAKPEAKPESVPEEVAPVEVTDKVPAKVTDTPVEAASSGAKEEVVATVPDEPEEASKVQEEVVVNVMLDQNVKIPEKQAGATAEPPAVRQVLWLTTCETRPEATIWTKSEAAKQFQAWQNLPQPPANSAGAATRVQVKLVNVCEGAPWEGMLTKPTQMELFIQNQVLNNTDTNTQHYVLFSDSDALLNAYAFPKASMVMDKFHSLLKPGQSILIGAEPACWIGHICTKKDLRMFYPDAPDRTPCNYFVNSGLFMGKAEAILDMVKAELQHDNAVQVNTTLHTMLEAINKMGVNSDQARLSAWYSVNKHIAQLDSAGALFRNLVFGSIDITKIGTGSRPRVGKRARIGYATCGTKGVRSCGYIHPDHFITGSVNQTTNALVMDPVPNCPTDPNPLFVHGNGYTKKDMKRLLEQRDASVRETLKKQQQQEQP